MRLTKLGRLDIVFGLLLGGLVFSVYLFTLSRGVFPGPSAGVVVQQLGLMPRMNPDQPIWQVVVHAVSRLPFGNLPLRLNFFSALCSFLTVWLVYDVTARIVMNVIVLCRKNEAHSLLAARLAGVAASLFLAFSVPFWVAATRAGSEAFDLLLLLAMTRLWLSALGSERSWPSLVFAFLLGVGVTEFATLILLAPLFIVSLLYGLWRREVLSIGAAVQLLLAALAGASVYVFAAWQFTGSPGYELREYSSMWEVLLFMWRSQYYMLTQSLPKVGWLVILVLTVAPWATALLVARKALNEEKDWSFYFLHLIMVACTVVVALRLPFVRWPLYLVTPLLLAAVLFGYLVAYWFLVPAVWWPEDDRPVVQWLRRWFGAFLVLPAFGLLAVVPFRNLPVADGRPALYLTRLANAIVDGLPENGCLATDGTLDTQLFVAARERGRTINFVDPSAGNNRVYVKLISEKLDNPRLRNQAQISLIQMLQTWIADEPDAEAKLALMTLPDLWIGGGKIPLADCFWYRGVARHADVNIAETLTRHRAFWGELIPNLRAFQATAGPELTPFANYLVRRAGSVANNLGVFLEDAGRPAEALEVYNKAREIDPENVSALLNLMGMAERNQAGDQKDRIAAEMKVFSERKQEYEIWGLSQAYGYVRHPDAFLQLGWTWAVSGRAGLAVSGLERALALASDKNRGDIQETLADVYLSQSEDEKSQAMYETVLQREPGNYRAQMGLARLALRAGDFARAKERYAQARASGAPQTLLALETGAMQIMAGNDAEARVVLEELVKNEPTLTRAWALLASVRLRLGDESGFDDCIQRLKSAKDGQELVALLRADAAWKSRDYVAARRYFEDVLKRQPANRKVLERLLRMDMVQAREKEIREHARSLLQVDPQSAMGFYALGSVQLNAGELALAETSLRQSLAYQKSPEALNDLAWALFKQDKFEEAEQRAREVVALEPRLATAWDTLGVVLLKKGALAEAQPALEKCLSLNPNDLQAHLHLAELHVAAKNVERAREMTNMLEGKRTYLPPEDQATLAALVRRLDQAR